MEQIDQFDESLQRHVLSTYFGLRLGMGVIALLFPLLLCIGGGVIAGAELQGSLSAYYHTPMRNAFVGGLFAIGSFLYLYKGFTSRENIALNVAGILSIGIAIFPMEGPEYAPITYTNPVLHGTCAILFFVAIAYVCIRRSGDTLHLVTDLTVRRRYKWTYWLLGVLMVALPSTAALVLNFGHYVFETKTNIFILGVEWAAVWVFAAYWIIKTIELRKSDAERKIVRIPR